MTVAAIVAVTAVAYHKGAVRILAELGMLIAVCQPRNQSKIICHLKVGIVRMGIFIALGILRSHLRMPPKWFRRW